MQGWCRGPQRAPGRLRSSGAQRAGQEHGDQGRPAHVGTWQEPSALGAMGGGDPRVSIPICTHSWGVPEKPVLMCVSGKGAGHLSLTSTIVRQAPSWVLLPGREGVMLSLSRSKVRALVQGHLARDEPEIQLRVKAVPRLPCPREALPCILIPLGGCEGCPQPGGPLPLLELWPLGLASRCL